MIVNLTWVNSNNHATKIWRFRSKWHSARRTRKTVKYSNIGFILSLAMFCPRYARAIVRNIKIIISVIYFFWKDIYCILYSVFVVLLFSHVNRQKKVCYQCFEHYVLACYIIFFLKFFFVKSIFNVVFITNWCWCTFYKISYALCKIYCCICDR